MGSGMRPYSTDDRNLSSYGSMGSCSVAVGSSTRARQTSSASADIQQVFILMMSSSSDRPRVSSYIEGRFVIYSLYRAHLSLMEMASSAAIIPRNNPHTSCCPLPQRDPGHPHVMRATNATRQCYKGSSRLCRTHRTQLMSWQAPARVTRQRARRASPGAVAARPSRRRTSSAAILERAAPPRPARACALSLWSGRADAPCRAPLRAASCACPASAWGSSQGARSRGAVGG